MCCCTLECPDPSCKFGQVFARTVLAKRTLIETTWFVHKVEQGQPVALLIWDNFAYSRDVYMQHCTRTALITAMQPK